MTPASGKRYEPQEHGTPGGKLFRIVDTHTGRHVSMSQHRLEEALKICDRLNKLRRDSQQVRESQGERNAQA